MNANITNTKQPSWPEKLLGLSRNRPLDVELRVQRSDNSAMLPPIKSYAPLINSKAAHLGNASRIGGLSKSKYWQILLLQLKVFLSFLSYVIHPLVGQSANK